jgi:hypothetical protein
METVKKMWLVTIDGAPQRVDAVINLWGNRTVSVNGSVVARDRDPAVMQPADFNVGSARCSVHLLGTGALFVNGQRIEPHLDASTSVSLSTSLAVSAGSMGVATGSDVDRSQWVLANRIVSFFVIAGGSLRRTDTEVVFAAVKAKYDVRFAVSDILCVTRKRSPLIPVDRFELKDGRVFRFTINAADG